MDMAAERSRDGLTGLRDEENRLGWPPIASALENESMRRWRLLDGPVCARSPLDFGVNPGTVQRIIRLSPPQALPSYDRPATWLGAAGQRAAERLGRSAGKPEMF